ncbi:MAG: AAA family ATPase [Methanomicrobiales archaeon]|nr:AAA family ATPase [Methanomicrobiales archaeon]
MKMEPTALTIDQVLAAPRRETFLFYGNPDCGKTTRVLEIAALHSDRKFAVIDGDGRFRRVWRDEWPGVRNIAYYPVRDWTETRAAYEKAKKELGTGDWLVCEMIDKYWDWAYNYYYQEVRAKSTDDLLLELKKNTKGPKGVADPDSITTTRIVKLMHNAGFADEMTSFLDCHILWTAAAQPLLIDLEGKETLDLFQDIGYKADGEKRNPYRVDTCIFFEVHLKGGQKRMWTTVKDKGRPKAWRQEFDGSKRAWWLDYCDFVAKSSAPVETMVKQ